MCTTSLMDLDDEENVEILCALIENCGEKMMQSNKQIELMAVVGKLKQKRNWCNRIRFMVADVLNECDKWFSEKRKNSPFKNAFAGLENSRISEKDIVNQRESDEAKLKKDDKIKDDGEKQHHAASTFEQIIELIAPLVEDIPNFNDYTSLIDEMRERTKEINIEVVLEAHFL